MPFNVALVTVVYNFPFISATSTFYVRNRRSVALAHNLPNNNRNFVYKIQNSFHVEPTPATHLMTQKQNINCNIQQTKEISI